MKDTGWMTEAVRRRISLWLLEAWETVDGKYLARVTSPNGIGETADMEFETLHEAQRWTELRFVERS